MLSMDFIVVLPSVIFLVICERGVQAMRLKQRIRRDNAADGHVSVYSDQLKSIVEFKSRYDNAHLCSGCLATLKDENGAEHMRLITSDFCYEKIRELWPQVISTPAGSDPIYFLIHNHIRNEGLKLVMWDLLRQPQHVPIPLASSRPAPRTEGIFRKNGDLRHLKLAFTAEGNIPGNAQYFFVQEEATNHGDAGSPFIIYDGAGNLFLAGIHIAGDGNIPLNQYSDVHALRA